MSKTKSHWISVDIESDGPCPGLYSMIELGAVSVRDHSKNIHIKMKPISDNYVQAALDVTNSTREQTMSYPSPLVGLVQLNTWLLETLEPNERPVFVSDNNGFDWQFVNYYFWKYLGENPFGYSSRNIGDLYKGMEKNCFTNFKHLRKTKHTHNPVDDATGNAEALVYMKENMNLKVKF